MFIKSKEPYFLFYVKEDIELFAFDMYFIFVFLRLRVQIIHFIESERSSYRSLCASRAMRWSNLILRTYTIIEQWTCIFDHKRRKSIPFCEIRRAISFTNLLNWNPCNQINNDVLYSYALLLLLLAVVFFVWLLPQHQNIVMKTKDPDDWRLLLNEKKNIDKYRAKDYQNPSNIIYTPSRMGISQEIICNMPIVL